MDLQDALTQAGWNVLPFSYRMLCAGVALLVGVGSAMFFQELAAGVSGVICFWVLQALPAVFAQKRADDLEADLSVALRLMAVQLPFSGFECAVENAVKTGLPNCHPALLAWARAVESGESVSTSLRRLSSQTNSLWVRKAAMQILFSYRQGSGAPLLALADELSARHVEKRRLFASKTVFLSAWFVVLGSLVPMMLAAYVLVGSAFLSFSFSPEFVLAGFALGLPLVLGLVVFYAFLVAPGGLRG
ncbi:hypothetical protein HY572_03365 [Candidatus Micrarchaeota archaeon]|nr:hypothetical protein [Candidatus Micrarchaeota archaeon]